MRRCLAEIGSDWIIDVRTNVIFAGKLAACGTADCAATHTGHLAVSIALEW